MAAPWLWWRPGNLPTGRTGETGSQSPSVGASLSFASSTTSTKGAVISSGNLEVRGEVASLRTASLVPPLLCTAPLVPFLLLPSRPLLSAGSLPPSLPIPHLRLRLHLSISLQHGARFATPPAPPLRSLNWTALHPPPQAPSSFLSGLLSLISFPTCLSLCVSLPLCLCPPISPSSPSLSPCCLSSLFPCVHPVPLSLTNPPLALTHLSPSTFLFPFIHSQPCVVHMTSCPSPWLSPPPPPDSDSLPSFSAPAPPSPLLSLQAPSRSACFRRAPSLATQPCRLGAQTEPASILHSLGQGGRGPGTGSAGGRNLPAQSRGSLGEKL